MSADFLCVPFNSDVVKQVAPPPKEVIWEVAPTAEDGNFAHHLATALLKHIGALGEALPGLHMRILRRAPITRHIVNHLV